MPGRSDDPFTYTGATINGFELGETGSIDLTLVQNIPENFYGDALRPLSIKQAPTITATAKLDQATYQQMLGVIEAPLVTVTMTHEHGEPDPFYKPLPALRDLLRRMWDIVSFSFRQAAGRVVPYVKVTYVIPDCEWTA